MKNLLKQIVDYAEDKPHVFFIATCPIWIPLASAVIAFALAIFCKTVAWGVGL